MKQEPIFNNTITHSSWKSKDLTKICAFLNTNGGVITYTLSQGDTYSSIDRLKLLINKKLKKIGPEIEGLVYVSDEDIGGDKCVKVCVKPSTTACYVNSRSGEKTYYILNGKNIIKTSEDIIKASKQETHIRKSISKLTPNMTIPDTLCVDKSYEFKSGHKVPIYEVFSVYGFNRIVGYLKYLNRTFGNVYSRGQCELYKSLIPSLYRDKLDLQAEDKKIDILVNRFINDNKLLQTLSLNVLDREQSRYRVEGVLQHYGATTSFLDVVDNHWIALWMGLNRYIVVEQIDKYAKYVERTIPIIEKISGKISSSQEDWDKEIYQYVLLIAVPYSYGTSVDGINITNDIIEIDLRKSLPSTFLRPHAQHGLVIKKNIDANSRKSEDYDLSTNVVAIIKIRIDRAKQWIGNGELLTQDNLIPPPGYDPGYDLLLSKYNIFSNSSLKITKYM